MKHEACSIANRREHAGPPGFGAHTPDAFAAFADALVARGRRPKTVSSYRSDWLGLCHWWLATYGESLETSDLDGDAVEAYKMALQASGLTPSTVNRKLVFIKRFADWALASGIIEEGAHGRVRAVAAAQQAPRRPRALSDIELRRFLREVDKRAGPRDVAIVYTLLQTGLRVGELVALRREHVGLGGRAGFVRVEEPRAGRGRVRRVPIGPLARRALQVWLELRGDHDGPLFVGERGALTANAVQRLVRKYTAFAKISASPQVLRHTFALCWLSENDNDLVGLADTLGHESLDTTRLYVTPPPEAPLVARSDTVGPMPRPIAIRGGHA